MGGYDTANVCVLSKLASPPDDVIASDVPDRLSLLEQFQKVLNSSPLGA